MQKVFDGSGTPPYMPPHRTERRQHGAETDGRQHRRDAPPSDQVSRKNGCPS